MKPGVAERAAAARALGRVLRAGAYSNRVVVPEAERFGAEVAATQRLLYGALRGLIRIDAILSAHVDRPLGTVDDVVCDVLRIATVELESGGARHGVVDSAVEAVRRLGKARAAGFVNAVLRNLYPAVAETVALRLGVPEWLLASSERALAEGNIAFWEASNQPAAVGIWEQGGPGSEGGVGGARYLGPDEPVPASAIVIDPASAAVVTALDVMGCRRVVDLAAAPGGKTAMLRRLLSSEAMLVAGDRHERRLQRARRRLSDAAVHWLVADAASPPLPHRSFDRVLLDAPCSGLGTLRRRPEIRHRVDRDAPIRLGAAQRRMLVAALDLVRPGGRLVYSVCTVLPEETSDVVAGLGARPPALSRGMPLGDGWLLAPHLTGTDGMFLAVFDL